jgi:hypothetical protein
MNLLPKFLLFFLVLTLNQCESCGPDMCNQTVGAGVTAVYQTGNGSQVQVTGGLDGNISFPCGATVTVIQ